MSEVMGNICQDDWRSKAKMPVLLGSCLLPLLLIMAAVSEPVLTSSFIVRACDFYLAKFPHWIIWSVSLFLLCSAMVALIPSVGRQKLGTEHDQTQFSYFSWFSMIFGAGMGVGLLTWGVAEPVAGMQNNPDVIRGVTTAGTWENTSSALKWSYAHWGFAGWAGYAIVGLAIAYTGYRQRLPLTIRTALIPLFGNAMKGPLGHLVDVATVVATLLGIIQILGYALDEFVVCVAYTTKALWLLDAKGSATVASKIATSGFIMLLAAVSAMSGIARGIKWLSNINMLLTFGLLTIMLFAGSFAGSFNNLFTSLFDYLTNLPSMLVEVWMKDGTEIGDNLQAWQGEWTLYHWAGWWLVFSPFIGVFLAKVSKGRTLRQYVFTTVVLPAILTIVWMSWIGGNAMALELDGIANGKLAEAEAGQQIFLMVQYLFEPWVATIVSVVMVILLITYLTTTIDSAVIVTTSILRQECYTLNSNKSAVMMWSVLLTLSMILLIVFDGFSSIRGAMVVAAAPISVLMVLLCVSLGLAIYKDKGAVITESDEQLAKIN